MAADIWNDLVEQVAASGPGDVIGPASAVDNRIVVFDGATGKLVKLGGVTIADLQLIDSDLTAIAALTPTNDDIIQRKAGAWANRTMGQLKTDLALVKGDVGLGNVDNTSDANKPVSTAQQAALDLKVSRSMMGGQLGTGVAASVGASATNYTTLYAGGTTGLSGTEANKRIPMAYAGTVRNFRVVTTSAQGAGGSLVFTIRKNGANTAVIVTVAAGAAAGVFSDTTNSVGFAAGDLLSISILNNDAGATSCTITSFSFEYDS